MSSHATMYLKNTGTEGALQNSLRAKAMPQCTGAAAQCATAEHASGSDALEIGALRDAGLHLGPEVADEALHGPCGRVAKRADRVSLDLLRHLRITTAILSVSVARSRRQRGQPSERGSAGPLRRSANRDAQVIATNSKKACCG